MKVCENMWKPAVLKNCTAKTRETTETRETNGTIESDYWKTYHGPRDTSPGRRPSSRASFICPQGELTWTWQARVVIHDVNGVHARTKWRHRNKMEVRSTDVMTWWVKYLRAPNTHVYGMDDGKGESANDEAQTSAERSRQKFGLGWNPASASTKPVLHGNVFHDGFSLTGKSDRVDRKKWHYFPVMFFLLKS